MLRTFEITRTSCETPNFFYLSAGLLVDAGSFCRTFSRISVAEAQTEDPHRFEIDQNPLQSH